MAEKEKMENTAAGEQKETITASDAELNGDVKENQAQIDVILASVKKQEKCAVKGLWHQRIRTLVAVVIAVAVIGLLGTVEATLHDVQTLAGNADQAVGELMGTVDELMTTVEELDLKNSIDNIDELVTESRGVIEASSKDIEQSLSSISEVDFEGLNRSIGALETITTKIGRLFGYKG